MMLEFDVSCWIKMILSRLRYLFRLFEKLAEICSIWLQVWVSD